ncbi:TM2 domain-containing protein [Dehalococcoidia bacterium]|nr:TM2 domain-containing protein [Dehalococcoidia bacterium]
MNCPNCQTYNLSDAIYCSHCGVAVPKQEHGTFEEPVNSEKSFVATLILCFLLGGLGVHRFYVGKIGTGILMLLTLGGLGIWQLVDLIVIAVQNFKDNKGLVIKA